MRSRTISILVVFLLASLSYAATSTPTVNYLNCSSTQPNDTTQTCCAWAGQQSFAGQTRLVIGNAKFPLCSCNRSGDRYSVFRFETLAILTPERQASVRSSTIYSPCYCIDAAYASSHPNFHPSDYLPFSQKLPLEICRQTAQELQVQGIVIPVCFGGFALIVAVIAYSFYRNQKSRSDPPSGAQPQSTQPVQPERDTGTEH